MRRGEVWWVEFDERRPVVLLSEDEPSGFAGDAGRRSSRVPTSPAWGSRWQSASWTGLPFEGVLRFAFPRPGFTPCTWLTTVSRDDLIERAGALSPAKLSEIDDALRAAGRRTEWTQEAAARLSEIKDSSVGGLRQTEKERTPTLTKVDLVRTTDGPRRPSNKVTIWEGRGLARFRSSRPVSSPRPSNRACGSPAHGLPTFFTGGVRPSRASPGRAGAG